MDRGPLRAVASAPGRRYLLMWGSARSLGSRTPSELMTMSTTISNTPGISVEDIDLLIHADHWNPFAVLGPHEAGGRQGRVVRAFLPEAQQGLGGRPVAGRARRPGRRWTGSTPTASSRPSSPTAPSPFPYRLAVEDHEGHSWEFVDAYQFGPVLTDFDLHLLGEGTHYRNFERLGAHLRDARGVPRRPLRRLGARTPMRVSVVGNFNHWDGRRHPMRSCGPTGIWEIFIPDLGQGEVYKFEIKSRLQQLPRPEGRPLRLRRRAAAQDRVDRLGRHQLRAGTTTTGWRTASRRQGLDAPISIYEVHLGSWKRKLEEGNRFLNYRELADELVEYLERHALHPRRADADQRAPVRRQLGLPAGRLLRPDLAARHARRLRLLRRHAAPARLSA